MENIPAEVLEIVFHPLSKKEDIENCFNVNSKWRHIITNMFAKKSMFLFYNYVFLHTFNLERGMMGNGDLPPSRITALFQSLLR